MAGDAGDSDRFVVVCSNDHRRAMSPSELEDFIVSGEHQCTRCSKAADFEGSELILECQICSDVFAVGDVEEAMHTMEMGCAACQNRGFDGQSIHVPGSWQYSEDAYEWMRSGKDGKPLVRKNRSDYWEGVIHFCSAGEFASIFRDGRLRAATTGYFRKPAVCLTEAPESGWAELRERHGQFGIVFRKSDLIRVGGGPVLYLSEERIRAQNWHDSLRPFVNLLRITPGKSKWDYLHEREWRTPADLVLAKTPPFAVIAGEFDRATPGWRDIFGALMQYEELYLPSGEKSPEAAAPH